MICDELANLWVDAVAPAAARENAEVACAFHIEVEAAVGGNAGAQVVRGFGLACA